MSATYLAIGFVSILSVAHAGSSFSPCVPGTVASYEAAYSVNSGIGCTVGILEFTSFNFTHTLNGNSVSDPDQVFLTPISGGFSFTQTGSTPQNPIPLQVAPNDNADYDIFWHYFVDPGPRTDTASMEMDPPFGDATVIQFFCNESTLGFNSDHNVTCRTDGSALLQTNTVHNPAPLISTVTFQTPSVQGDVLTRILLHGGTGGAGFDALNSSQTIIGNTPEPFSFALGLSGLAALYLTRKRFF